MRDHRSLSGLSPRPLGRRSARPSLPRRLRGRTLIELMVALTIGLVVVSAVSLAYLSTSRTARYADGLSDVADTGQAAMTLIGNAIRQAGFGEIVGSDMTLGPGDVNALRSQTLFGDGAHLAGCSGFRFVDDTAANPACAATGANLNADTLFVRFQGDSVIPPAQGALTDCLGVAVPQEPLPAGHLGLTRVAARPMVQNVYFVQDGRLWCRGNGRPTPADAFAPAQQLLANVEQFKVFYGFDDVRFNGGAGAASASLRSLRDAAFLNGLPAAQNPWDFVISVHVCMVVRSAPSKGAALSGSTTFTRCPQTAAEAGAAGVVVAAPDGAVRRTYNQVFVVRSRSPASPREFLP